MALELEIDKLSEEYITSCLRRQDLPHSPQFLAFTWYKGPVLKDQHKKELDEYIKDLHYNSYANNESKMYVKEDQKRIEKEEEQAIVWLIRKGYADYFLINVPLPLGTHYFIHVANGEDMDIGEQFRLRVKDHVDNSKDNFRVTMWKILEQYE